MRSHGWLGIDLAREQSSRAAKKKGESKMSSQSKKETWKFILQLVLSVVSAICTTLGVTSCM